MLFRKLCQPDGFLKVVTQARVMGLQNIYDELAAAFAYHDQIWKHRAHVTTRFIRNFQ